MSVASPSSSLPTAPDRPVLVRFAPSPTGSLHLGNARVALLNALFARARGGGMILRLDDTDPQRSQEAFAEGIRRDLAWLGLSWVREERQSARAARHAQAAEVLRRLGRLYPCYETAEELEYKRRRQRAQGLPPVYDRAALALSEAERARLEAEGRRPHWRFRLDPEDVRWDDLARGPCHADTAHLSDPVLVREDGALLYTLPSVVDDLDFGITHVIRGEDHVTNTAVQIQVFRVLAEALPLADPASPRPAPPAWAHLPLVVGADGAPLSKRSGDLALAGLRDQGIEPEVICALLATLGTGQAPDPAASLDSLAGSFDLAAFGRAAPRLDPAELERLNARRLHGLSLETVTARGYAVSPAVWEAVRPNLARLADLPIWQAVVDGPLPPPPPAPAPDPDRRDAGEDSLLAKAADLLPPEPWDGTTWKTWTEAVKAATGRKGRALFMPLRLALTGRDQGPELAALLPLIGADQARARLQAAAQAAAAIADHATGAR